MTRSASACGKVILSGEYAVVFGFPGIAIPSPLTVRVTIEEGTDPLKIRWIKTEAGNAWETYATTIVHHCEAASAPIRGTLTIESSIPLGKGMGSSTALVCAITRLFLGNDRARAEAIERTMNPEGSGIDFAVIWEERPLRFQHGSPPEQIPLPFPMDVAMLLDTGKPDQTTTELVAWVKNRATEPSIQEALAIIGGCADRLIRGEIPLAVLRDHHHAQVALGVVPESVQALIAEIEASGGAAKVVGAGARTGGGGIVLAMGDLEKIAGISRNFAIPCLSRTP